MTDLRRLCFAAFLVVACVQHQAVAQAFKCRQADGSVAYQDRACPAGTAASGVIDTAPLPRPRGPAGTSAGSRALPGDVSTGSRDGLFHFSRTRNELTPACRQSTDDVSLACTRQADTAKQRCLQSRVSTTCQAQTGLLRARRDPACEQQIFSCETDSLRDFPACMHRELPAPCMDQIRAANRAHDR